MPKFTRIRLVCLFVIIAAVAVLSSVRFDREARANAKSNAATEQMAVAVSATMTSSLPAANCPPGPGTFDATCNGLVNPGDTIRYAVTITNTGDTDATGLNFADTLPTTTSLVAGSTQISPIAMNDAFPVTGNVRIATANSATLNLLTNDVRPSTGTNVNLAATVETKKSTQCTAVGAACPNNVTIAADGSFTYNPPAGYEGADSFTYTITDTTPGNGLTATGTVNLTVAGMIWFVNSAAASNGDGRLSSPFNCLVGAACFSTSANDPGDNIFLYSGAYAAGLTLKNTQKLIGQGATDTIAAISGLTPATGSDPLPGTNEPVAGTFTSPSLTGAVNGITLAQNNVLRGFDVGNVGNANRKINGSGFGQLTMGKATEPDVALSGSGMALFLLNGTIAATSGLTSAASTGSSAQGIVLSQITSGTLAVGSTTIAGAGTVGVEVNNSGANVDFGPTGISSGTTQGILIATTTGNITFGNTTITGGTDGVSLQNNSAGTRTFGTLSVTNNSGIGFLHGNGGGANGGGATTFTGQTTITNPGGRCVDIQNSTTAISFAGLSAQSCGGTGVFVNANAAGGTTSFGKLDITPDANQIAFNATGNTGSISSSSGTVSATGAQAIAVSSSTLAMTLDVTSQSAGAVPAINLTSANGSIVMNGGTITGNATATTFVITSGNIGVTYKGGITQANNQTLLSVTGGHSGSATFNTGTISASGGNGLQFDNADGIYSFTGTTTLAGGDAGIDILNGSGGGFTFTGTTITSPSGIAFNVDGTGAAGTVTAAVAYNGAITQASNAAMVNIKNHSTGTITFSGGTLSATNGTGLQFDNADGTYNFNGTNIFNGGDAGIDILNGSGGTFSFSSNTTIGATTSPSGVDFLVSGGTAAVTYAGTLKKTTAGRIIDIQNHTSGTIAFSGAITALTSSGGIFMDTNVTSSQVVNFTGGLSLATGTSDAFTAKATLPASSGGTVNATQDNSTIINTISSTTGTALNVANTTIGASGLTFRSISANGGTNGIILNTTGAGAFTVTGDGTNTSQGGNSSGGTIQNLIGGDGTTQLNGASNGIGLGIYLKNTSSVTIQRMNIHDASNFGVEVENSSAFVMKYTTVSGTNGNNAGQEESSVRLLELSGTNTLDNNNISGGFTDNVRLDNHTAALTDLIFTNNNIHDNNVTSGNQGFLVDFVTGAAQTLHITGNTCSHVRAECVDVGASGGAISGSALINIVMNNNIFTGNRSTDLGGGFEIQTANFDGHVRYDISGNNLQPTAGNFGVNQGGAIQVFAGAASSTAITTGVVEGRINNNTVGVTGVANSGTQQGSGFLIGLEGSGTHTTQITNNTIRQFGNSGMQITAGDAGITGGTFNIAVNGNTIAEKANAAGGAPNGILASFGTTSTGPNNFTVNIDISGNSIAGTGNNVNLGEEDFRIRQRFNTDVFLKGYGGGLSDTNAVVSFIQGQNTGNETGTATVQNSPPHGFHNLASVPPPTVPTIVTPVIESGVAQIELSPANIEVGAPLGEMAYADIQDLGMKANGELGETASAAIEIPMGLGELACASVGMTPAAVDDGQPTFAILAALGDRMVSEISPTVYSQGVVEPEGSGGTINANIGTLPAGKSVTIFFDTKIDDVNTLAPNVFSISNQGTVSGGNFANVSTDGDGNAANGTQPTLTTIVQPETVTKAFNPTSNFKNAVTILTFTVKNQNPGTAANAIAFTDTLPAGLVIADATTTNTCGGTLQDQAAGSISAGDTAVNLVNGGPLAASPLQPATITSCTITVHVTSSVSGGYDNTTGLIFSTEGATGLASNTAHLNISVLTSAGVSVSGRVLTHEGRGVTNARVTLMDSAGVTRTVPTGRNGTFNFDDVPVGFSYSVSVTSQRFTFAPQVIVVQDQVTGVDFTAEGY